MNLWRFLKSLCHSLFRRPKPPYTVLKPKRRRRSVINPEPSPYTLKIHDELFTRYDRYFPPLEEDGPVILKFEDYYRKSS